jgi:1,4-dihydroxy-2-naphthoate octaprenyltransferase
VTDVSINFTGLNIQKLQTWILALRAPFFTASIVPLLIGMAISFYETKTLDFGLGFLTLISGIAIQAGTNLANDYYDQSADAINDNYTQFNGGSRMIQNDIIAPRTILTASIVSFIIGIVTAVVILINTQGWLLLIFLAIAVLLGFFYTAFPSLSYNGLGEIAVFVGFGPLGIYAAYYIQLGHINSSLLLIISIPIALLISMVLLLNEFQDGQADTAAGKKTLVVSIGKKRSIKIYTFGMIVSYVFLVLVVFVFSLPIVLLLPIITLPLAIKAITRALQDYEKIFELLPANGMTILVHFSFGLLMALSFVLA